MPPAAGGAALHPFRYVAARTVDEAVAVLAEHGSRAKPLAGGTDILVQLRGERFEIDVIVDVKSIPELSALSLNGGLVIGAAAPCCRIYEDSSVSAAYPGIIDAASLIGGIQIQSRASLGGNLCNASPSADGVCPLIAHSGVARIAGPGGERLLPVEEFCTGPGRSALQDGELLTAIELPAPARGFGAAYQRFTPRNEMDIAVAGVASAITLDESGSIASARIALAAVGPTPILARRASAFLAGKAATVETFAEAGEIASTEASPLEDMRGTPMQRLQLVRTLTRRTLGAALERAKTNSQVNH